MPDPHKSIFLSYRRDRSGAMAHLVRNDLIAHRFDVFMDVHGLGSGEFERALLQEIEQRAHFLLLLEPRSLERVGLQGDWLHREIAHALATRRNVVPVLFDGARMPSAEELPADIARLPSHNALSVPHDYFPEAMHKLRGRFLGAREPLGPPEARGRGEEPLLDAPVLVVCPLEHGRSVVRWTEVSDAATYVLEAAGPDGFTSSSVVQRGLAREYERPLDLDPVRWYRVCALGVEGEPGRWSEVVSSEVVPSPQVTGRRSGQDVWLSWTAVPAPTSTS